MASRSGRMVHPGHDARYSQRNVRIVTTMATTAHAPTMTSGRTRSPPPPSATRNASASAAPGRSPRSSRADPGSWPAGHDDPAKEHRGDEQDVGERQRGLGPQRPGHGEPEPRERGRPERQRDDEADRRASGPGRQPKTTAAITISTVATTTSTIADGHDLAASSPVRPSGEPPSRLRTPYERS